jgi:4-hydroxythreonine-4-phosphate dehydrogenase
MKKPVLAITSGDPAGIGPEVVLKALAQRKVYAVSQPLVVGDARVFLQKNLRSNLKINPIIHPAHARFRFGTVDVLHLPNPDSGRILPGQCGRIGGMISFEAVAKSLDLGALRLADGVVHAPISKEAWKAAGIPYLGHTELIRDWFLCEPDMAIIAGPLRTVMVTRHIPLKDVPKNITAGAILRAVGHAHQFVLGLGIKQPRIGVCALNPHAGESGILGQEESGTILPAVRKAQKKYGSRIVGPLPADSAFRDHRNGLYDCLVTLYHDQSMIPLKIMDDSRLVNVTLGIPFPRTSPGHGTAFGIAGKDRADFRPMMEAILTAGRLCAR